MSSAYGLLYSKFVPQIVDVWYCLLQCPFVLICTSDRHAMALPGLLLSTFDIHK